MKILVWGAAAQSRIILDTLSENENLDYIIFDHIAENIVSEFRDNVITTTNELKKAISECDHFLVGIGGSFGFARYKISNILISFGLKPLNVFHKTSQIEKGVTFGYGTQCLPKSLICLSVKLGDCVIINSNASIDHDCKIGNGVHVMGSAAIAGNVTVGDFSTIGTNATILPNIEIGRNVFVGAGAVVNKNIDDNKVVAGVPFAILREQELFADIGPLRELIES